MKRLLVIIAIAALSGCTALRQPEEIAWQAIHAVDTAQTVRIAQSPDCYREATPATRALIGEHPSTSDAVAWGIGTAAIHAGVSDLLLNANISRNWYNAWQMVTLIDAGSTVGHNYGIGIRIGAKNTRTDCR